MLHVLELSSNKPAVESQPHLHINNIIQISINYIGGINDRQLAIVDENHDLFLLSIRTSGFGRVCKIGIELFELFLMLFYERRKKF